MSERKLFPDSVIPLPEEPGVAAHGLLVQAAPAVGDETMTVLFSLTPPADVQMRLEERVAKGEIVPPGELSRDFGADQATADRLVAWLQDHGYEVVGRSPGNLGIYARATTGIIAQTLQVQLARVTKEGVTYTAASNAPSLPAEVADGVQAIIGLQPFRKANKHAIKCRPKDDNRIGLVTGRQPLSGPGLQPAAAGVTKNIQNAPPYLVSEILTAYGADGLEVTGSGQTIAILIDTFPDDSDLQEFSTSNGIPDLVARVDKVNVTGATLPVPEGEETLDVCWSGGIATGARVRVYASGSLRFVDLDMALDRILEDLETDPSIRQLSISLGLGEQFMGGAGGEVAVQHQKFLRLAAAGVNVFVSSGDAGSNPGPSGHDTTGPVQAEYESSDSCVIGVGGTSLLLSGGGQNAGETAWAGSGGGESIFFARPSWQQGNGVPAGAMRLVPDVSLAADPNEGAFLVLQGQVIQIGGTSWSAPVWAGFCALINEARLNAGLPTLPFLNPLLYPLMGTASFRDIDQGSNGAFSAAGGYDKVTGCGTPNVRELILQLTAQAPAALPAA